MTDTYFTNPRLAEIIRNTDVLVFDMNGLIIDDEPVQRLASNQVFEPYGISFSHEDWLDIVGNKPKEWMAHHITENMDLMDIIRAKDVAYQALIKDQIKQLVRPGFQTYFSWLKNKNMPVALATGTTESEMRFILGPEGLSIIDQFDFLICGDEVKKSKPDPEIYQAVRARFGDDLHYTVFEDTPIGATAAVKADMQAIAVPNRYTLHKDFPDGVIKIASMEQDTALL